MAASAAQRIPPGPPPGFGRALFGPFRRDPLKFFSNVARDYGDIASLQLFNFRTIFINHPDMIEDLLVTSARKFHKGRVLQANKRLFGEGLLTSEGDTWLRQR